MLESDSEGTTRRESRNTTLLFTRSRSGKWVLRRSGKGFREGFKESGRFYLRSVGWGRRKEVAKPSTKKLIN